MGHTPHTFRWIENFCYWLRSNASGYILEQSNRGFLTEEDARADFYQWHK